MEKTLYSALGLFPDASRAEIEEACLRLGEQCRPELNVGNVAAYERFAEIELAYATLLDPIKRARYDASIGRSRAGSFARALLTYARGKPIVTVAAAGMIVSAIALAIYTTTRSKPITPAPHSDIEAKCSLNGLGHMRCTFHNAGRTKQSVCVVASLMNPYIPETAGSDTVCSGIVEPSDVRERTATVRVYKHGDWPAKVPYTPYDFCMEQGTTGRTIGKRPTSWTEGCTIGYVPVQQRVH